MIASLDDTNQRKRAKETLVETPKKHPEQQERLSAMAQAASRIAHDFNNALVPILGLSELLLTRPEKLDDKEQLANYLQIMNAAAKQAAILAGRLREFYCPRKELESSRPFDLNQLVE